LAKVFKVPEESPQQELPNGEASAAEVFAEQIKRKAAEHPEQLPTQLSRMEFASVLDGLRCLPERENIELTI